MAERSGTRAADGSDGPNRPSAIRCRGCASQLGDPLLIKGGMRMQPTAFALDLIEQARPMLRGIQRVLSPRYVFDPASCSGCFGWQRLISCSPCLHSLLSRLRAEAPGVSAEWTAPREPTLLDVAEGQIDVAIVPAALRLPEGVASEPLGALGWRCYGRKGHPAFGEWSRGMDAMAASRGSDRRQPD